MSKTKDKKSSKDEKRHSKKKSKKDKSKKKDKVLKIKMAKNSNNDEDLVSQKNKPPKSEKRKRSLKSENKKAKKSKVEVSKENKINKKLSAKSDKSKNERQTNSKINLNFHDKENEIDNNEQNEIEVVIDNYKQNEIEIDSNKHEENEIDNNDQKEIEIINYKQREIENQVETRHSDDDLDESRSVTPEHNYRVTEDDEIVCRICQQKVDGNLKMYCGELSHGTTEEVTILDSRLSLFDGKEVDVQNEDVRAYDKITCFSVYCKASHLCPFDTGLIEKDKNIYLSGYLKPIYSEDPSITDGVPGKDFGPLVEWWTTGFDVGEKPTIGLSTALGDYILMEPAEAYAPYMKNAILKSYLGKIIIEYLVNEADATYEDLLCKLQCTPIPNCSTTFCTEDDLIRLTPFLCNQMISFDELADPMERPFVTAPCMRHLLNLAGIDLRCNTSQLQIMQRASNNIELDIRRRLQYKLLDKEGNSSSLFDQLLPYVKFEEFIKINESSCGSCKQCLRFPCGNCPSCINKQSCRFRRCFWQEIQDANEEDIRNEDISPEKVLYSKDIYKNTTEGYSNLKKNIEWLGPIVATNNGNKYYEAAKVDGKKIALDDFVCLRPCNAGMMFQFVKIVYMWEDEKGERKFHGHCYWRGKDTVLGEFANPWELFFVNICNDFLLSNICDQIDVIENITPTYWKGSVTFNQSFPNEYFCEKSYNSVTGRFYDLPEKDEDSKEQSAEPYKFCQIEENANTFNENQTPLALNEWKTENNKIFYEMVRYKDDEFFIGNSVYLKPKTLYFKYPMSRTEKYYVDEKYDEEKYPEMYRKLNNRSTNTHNDMPSTFDIAHITEIFTENNKIFLKVKKFYRPENTHNGSNLSKKSYLTLLFWSEEESVIGFNKVVKKCHVINPESSHISTETWISGGTDRFHFSKEYTNGEYVNISALKMRFYNDRLDPPEKSPKKKPLKTLNIFAGCGGIALGLKRSGLADICWAIEHDELSANIFKSNITNTSVFVADVKHVLNEARKGSNEIDGQELPLKGEVELLCATIPNKTFKSFENYKDTSLATFVEYCEFYRPKLFIVDIHENIFKDSKFFKAFLSCLVAIGYQVSFNVMQVGNYGAPQNCKRLIIFGAEPNGHTLPNYPNILNVFPKSLSQFHVVIDNKKYTPVENWSYSAPFRSINVQDAISDLPAITSGNNRISLDYVEKCPSHYQKVMRYNLNNEIFDHECKNLSLLVQARMANLSQSAGSDWRNLPNIVTTLGDETSTNKINYEFNDLTVGKSPKGYLRGVCSCAAGEKCDLNNRQDNTLIPWHLIHTAKQNNQWAGLYGRIQWDGYFGPITNPEPLGTEGPVIHPRFPRILSVRECARSRGFPDDFKFGENISVIEKYRILGQATSPLLFTCIGQKFVEILNKKESFIDFGDFFD